MKYKETEIKQYAIDTIKERLEYDKNYLDQDITEIHHDLFNTDYYIIGYYNAEQWLGNNVFECMEVIQDYQEMHPNMIRATDLSNSETLVNMYVYIIGEEILESVIKDIKQTNILELIFEDIESKNNNNKSKISNLWTELITT